MSTFFPQPSYIILRTEKYIPCVHVAKSFSFFVASGEDVEQIKNKLLLTGQKKNKDPPPPITRMMFWPYLSTLILRNCSLSDISNPVKISGSYDEYEDCRLKNVEPYSPVYWPTFQRRRLHRDATSQIKPCFDNFFRFAIILYSSVLE